MSRSLLGMLAALGLAYLPATLCAESPGDERTSVYREFRSAFDTADYATALPLAARVVALTRSQYGADAPELANPLSNLGTTYYRMRQYGLALDSYREALTLLDSLGNAVHEKLIRPLQGSGAALRGLQRDAEAIAPLKRAVDIVRNRDGLFAAEQLPILKALAGSYMAVGQREDAGRAQQYAYTVAESTYGKDGIGLLGPLDDYARWNEATGAYTVARALHARAVELADAAQGGRSPLAIDGLRGIARTCMLAYVNGELADPNMAAAETMPDSITGSTLPRVVNAPAAEGERALRNALQRLTAASPPQPRLQGEVTIDLGDWFLTAGSAAPALAQYRNAWSLLQLAGAEKRLASPEAIVYRHPSIAVLLHQHDPDDFEEQEVELRLDIEANGEARRISVIGHVEQLESAERAVVAAVKRALWRPAFKNGEPVLATDVTFREQVYVRKPKAVK